MYDYVHYYLRKQLAYKLSTKKIKGYLISNCQQKLKRLIDYKALTHIRSTLKSDSKKDKRIKRLDFIHSFIHLHFNNGFFSNYFIHFFGKPYKIHK